MTTLNRPRALTGLLLTLSVLGAGCGSDTSDDTTEGNATEGNAEASGSVEIWYTYPNVMDAPVGELIDTCESETGLEITGEAIGADYTELDQRIQAAVTAGDAPALSLQGLGQVEALGSAPTIDDLQQFIDDDSTVDWSGLDSFLGLARASTGRQVGVPFGVSVPVLFWNKAHFTEAGLDPERPPESMEQLLDYAQTLSDQQDSRVGLAIDYTLANNFSVPTLMANAGAQVIDDGELTIDSPESVQLLQALSDGVADQAVGAAPDIASSADAFDSGQASMHIGSITNAPGRAADMSDEFGTAPLPQGFGYDGPYRVYGSGAMWVMHASDEDAALAWQVLTCFLSTEAALLPLQHVAYLPPISDAAESGDVQAILAEEPYLQPLIDAAPSLEKLPSFGGPDGRRAAEAFKDAWVKAFNGEQSAADALSEAAAEIRGMNVEFS